jgi:hypothetical protein
MINVRAGISLMLSSFFCLSLMGMQSNDEELCLPFHRTPSYISSPLRHADSSLSIIMAANNADPKSLAKLLFERRFDEGSLNLALSTAQEANYIYSWPPKIKKIENFFPKGLFESNKKACICLLEQALTSPVTLNTEAPNKKRD